MVFGPGTSLTDTAGEADKISMARYTAAHDAHVLVERMPDGTIKRTSTPLKIRECPVHTRSKKAICYSADEKTGCEYVHICNGGWTCTFKYRKCPDKDP